MLLLKIKKTQDVALKLIGCFGTLGLALNMIANWLIELVLDVDAYRWFDIGGDGVIGFSASVACFALLNFLLYWSKTIDTSLSFLLKIENLTFWLSSLQLLHFYFIIKFSQLVNLFCRCIMLLSPPFFFFLFFLACQVVYDIRRIKNGWNGDQ